MIYNKFPAYVQLLRPFTLIAPFFAGLLGTLAPINDFSVDKITTALFAGLSLALLQASGQAVNQYSDYMLDKLAKPYRPIPSGKIDREEALGVGLLALIAGLFTSLFVSKLFVVFALILAFMSLFYSLPPISPRRVNCFINAVWLSIARGALPLVAVWSVYGDVFQILPHVVVVTLWVLAFQSTKDVVDMEYDKLFGIKTIPSTFGISGYKTWCIVNVAIMVGVIIAFKLVFFIPLIVLGITNILTLNRKATITENNVAWIGYYVGLALAYVALFFAFRA